ncbi:unnamed protein product [Symbiodinium sp. CCMP2592]|nr:unnamed protein product [Symbiodinium sp. CCMP2592]
MSSAVHRPGPPEVQPELNLWWRDSPALSAAFRRRLGEAKSFEEAHADHREPNSFRYGQTFGGGGKNNVSPRKRGKTHRYRFQKVPRAMPIIHKLLQNSSDVELEKVRESTVTSFTTIGVVAALLLTMEKTGESVGQDASKWIDCSRVPCNEIHVALSWLSLIGCAHAVLFTTCVLVWMAVLPEAATRDFFYSFPSVMVRATQSMMMVSTCWALDALWLAIIKHGPKLMGESRKLFLAVPGFGLFFHLIWSFYWMRDFAWHWPKEGYRYRLLETEASADPD